MDEKALKIVRDYIFAHLDKTDTVPPFDVYMVWKCKALQNWKYLISSTLCDGMYYELTSIHRETHTASPSRCASFTRKTSAPYTTGLADPAC